MSLTLSVLLTCFIAFIALGVPIYCSIGLSSVIAILFRGSIPLMLVPQRIYVSTSSFTLLSVPFFILVGDLMLQGGISRRLVTLARRLLGWAKGGMAYVTIVSSAMFGAISGSAVATTAAIGGLMYPEMKKSNYPEQFAAGLGAVSGTLGILIPPSIALIIYGTTVGASVGSLFLWGGVAGLVFTVFYMIAASCELRVRHVDAPVEPFPTLKEIWSAFKDAIWAILAPVIILGGIYSGIFTPSEAAVVATVYSLLIGFFVYRELNIKKLGNILVNAAISSGPVLLLIGVANVFSWLLTVEDVAGMIQRFVSGLGVNVFIFLLIVNVIYLMLGMLMETMPIIILTCPILFPIAVSLGINPVHFGVITVCNLAFGLFTPPLWSLSFYGEFLLKATGAQYGFKLSVLLPLWFACADDYHLSAHLFAIAARGGYHGNSSVYQTGSRRFGCGRPRNRNTLPGWRWHQAEPI